MTYITKDSWWPFVTVSEYNDIVLKYNSLEKASNLAYRANSDLRTSLADVVSERNVLKDRNTRQTHEINDLMAAKATLEDTVKKFDDKVYTHNDVLIAVGKILAGFQKSWKERQTNPKMAPAARKANTDNLNAYVNDLVETIPKKFP